MTANLMISIEANGSIDSHLIHLTARGAETLRDTLTRCQGLIPGEVATRLADAFASLEGLEVMRIDTSAIPTMPEPMPMVPHPMFPDPGQLAGDSALDPLAATGTMEPPPPVDPLAGILTTPAATVDGAPV